MIPALSILILSSINPINNFVSLKTYISQNAQAHCSIYFINEDIPDFPRVKLIEKNKDEFFAYLDTIDVEHKKIGSYYFFKKKAK
jgi:hypothetical protein